MNRLVKINYPDSTAATFVYDALGREILRSGTAETVEKAYDVAGNLISEKFVNQNKGWSYSFDLMGNRIQAVSPENETFKYRYDNLYRLVELDTGKASEKINYSYDALGRNIEEKRVDSTTANSFDSAGQLLEMKHYRLVKCRKSGNFWKKGKKHKNVGAVREPPIEKIIALRNYSYDLAGNRINMIDENGKVTSYEYDNSNWLTKVVYPNADVVTYAYNNAGDRVSEQLNEKPSVVYEYDAAGRLLSKGSETFSYDADGNMVTDAVATYTWNSDNRLTRVEKTIGGCKHDKFRKGHGFGHLKHGKETVVYEEYAYLPQDWRRITRKTGKYQINRRGDSRIAPKEQTFVSIYDGDDESHEYLLRKSKFKFRSKRHSRRESLKLFREFVGGPDSDDIKHTRYNRLSLAMLKDGLGSTIALTGINGRPIARINYDAWGEFRWPEKGKCRINDCDKFLKRFSKTRGLGRLRHNAHAFGKRFAYKLSPYLYTGRRYSTFTNQYFNRNRYYSPALGRFTSKDPIGFNGGINLYRYADNNPVRWVDPMGLKEILVWLEHSNYTYKYDISTAGGLREGREYWKQSSNLSEFERNHIVGSRTLKDELGAWKEYKINIPKGQLYWVLKEFEIDNWFANIFEETECKREFKRKEIIPRFLTEISLVRDSNPYPTKEYTTKGIFSPRENPINSFPKTFPNPIDGKRNYIYSQPIELPVEYEVAK